MMKLLRALDAGFTAFVDTLSPYSFPLLGDYVADSLEHDDEDDGHLFWPTDSSVAASAMEVGPGGVDAPSPPPGHPETSLLNLLFNSAQGLRELAHSGVSPNPASWWNGMADELLDHLDEMEKQGWVSETHEPTSGQPEPCLIAAAANGLALWIESGTCAQPTYWGSIVRELSK